jgi:hypothetical protein
MQTGRGSEWDTRGLTIRGGLRDAQAHLNKMQVERDRGGNLDSSKQTLNQYLDRWVKVWAEPRYRRPPFAVWV